MMMIVIMIMHNVLVDSALYTPSTRTMPPRSIHSIPLFIARPATQLRLRPSYRSLPRTTPVTLLPPRFISRPISIQAPGPISDPDRRDTESEPPIITQPPLASGSGIHSDPTSSNLSAATSLPAPPERPNFTPRYLQHPFDTHAFVSYLEKNGLDRETSRALMESVKDMIITRGKRTRDTMVGKEEAENVSACIFPSIIEIPVGLWRILIQAAYLFNAALSELRTELSVQTRNDGLALKAMAVAIRREVEQLEQKMQEDIQTLKHEYVIIYFLWLSFAHMKGTVLRWT